MSDEVERVAIIDSQGEESLHSRYTEALSHVEFEGVTPPQLQGQPVHPHGTWCGWDFCSQSLKKVSCLFIRVFDKDGRGVSGTTDYVNSVLKDYKPHRISNSWSSTTDGFGRGWVDKRREAEGDATIGYAAGNAGRAEQGFPQAHLVDDPQVMIVAAMTAQGKRAPFSSTGQPGRKYARVGYIGQDVMSLNGVTGEVNLWGGTSSSTPRNGGDMWANDITWREADSFLRGVVLLDINDNGLPDGIHKDYENLIREGGYHEDVGIGCAEYSRQKNMARTGLGLGTFESMRDLGISSSRERYIDAIPSRPQYHDFDRIG